MAILEPARFAGSDLCGPVTVYEVGARDGLQNEISRVSADVKVEFINRLVASGISVVEATSFVAPKWIPQLGDAETVMAKIDRPPGVEFPVLVPNMAGLVRARQASVDHVAVFVSVTESFSKRNLNRGVDEVLEMLKPVIQAAVYEGMWVRAYVSMSFGDPWQGQVSLDEVVEVASRLLNFGCDALCVADTIGVATPGHVQALLDVISRQVMPLADIAVHFHDTYGQALANTFAALEAGVRTVDASAGGLGGCPYADSATGNLATEDLVWMLQGLGMETGINLRQLVETSVWMAGQLGRNSPSRLVNALGRLDVDGLL